MNKPNILIVDDAPENLKKLKAILKDDYSIKIAKNGQEAIEVLHKNQSIDLILSDISMPQMDGYTFCEYVKKDDQYKEIPFIFITASHDSDDEIHGFELGAADFITKPFAATKVQARIGAHISLYQKSIELRDTINELDDYKRNLEEKVHAGLEEIITLNSEITATQKEVILTMGAIGESRSRETGDHVKRVAEYSSLLAELYGLTPKECETLKMASPMHDIGKVAIPDHILNKPGRHTDEESKIMKTHAELGYTMLQHSDREIFKTAAIVALEHHEKWNGLGYPKGLQEENIHIYGRITALADVFDALGHDRCYKKAWPLEDILELVKKERGEHFDPKLVDLFLDNLERFLMIKTKFDN